MTQNDFKALQTPLLVLFFAVLAAGSAVYYTDVLRERSEQRLERQQQQLKEARTRLQQSGDEKAIIVRYLGEFRQLQRIGFVGDEQRINWLDALRIANQQTGLFGVDYQIGAQRPYDRANELQPGSLALMQSVMKLRFRLLHEEDLLRFLGALSRQGAGIFSIDQCNVQRISASDVTRFQPNLAAECELSWITVKASAAKEKP